MFCKRIAPLVPFVDSITRLTATQLRRGLRWQQQQQTTVVSTPSPSRAAVEMEVRLGTLMPHRHLQASASTIRTCTMAVLGSESKHLYRFQAGIPAASFEALLTDLVRTGLTSATVVGSEHTHDTLILHTSLGRRLHFRLVPDGSAFRQHRPTTTIAGTTAAAATPVNMSQHLMADSFARPRFSVVGPHRRLSTPQVHTARFLRVTSKSSVGGESNSDVSCPEWGADLRFSLAMEKEWAHIPSHCTADEVVTDAAGLAECLAADPLVHARVQRRVAVPLTPYFRLELSAERVGTDVHRLGDTLRRHANASTSPPPSSLSGASLTFPVPHLSLPTLVHQVEVEVLLPPLLRDWKRYHGAVTVPVTNETGVEPLDPFLVQVAQDLLTLLQLLCQRR